jgi:predicted phosphodiesterase
MRVAALFDIHSNAPALDVVLEEVRRAGVDRIVVGGDVLPGPMPHETLVRLQRLEIPVDYIYGNGEIAVLEQIAGRVPEKVPERYRPTIAWTAGQMTPDDRRLVARWPKTCALTIDPLGEVLFCHATPQNENDIFTKLTPEERLLPVFQGLTASVVVCGHTHMQFDRTVGPVRVVNAGSVGMPFGPPGADWLLLGPDIELRHTDYDLNDAARQIRATMYPWDDGDFADRYILKPPTEQEMLTLYTPYSI